MAQERIGNIKSITKQPNNSTNQESSIIDGSFFINERRINHLQIIGIDHGYGGTKTADCIFHSGVVKSENMPFTKTGVIKYDNAYYICGTGRQGLTKDKTEDENYFILTLAAIAKEIEFRGLERNLDIVIAAGLPLTTFGKDKAAFEKYLMPLVPVRFEYEGNKYKINILDVKLYPQGYSAIVNEKDLLNREPSQILIDIGAWTVDCMMINNSIGEEVAYRFDIKETIRKGHSFKDYICPDSMDINNDHIKIGDKYARVLFLREYASYIKDCMITELCDLPRNMMLSIDILPIPTDEAIKEMNKRIMGVETDITRYQQKQNRNNNFSAVIPYDLEQMREETKEFMNDLTTRDQRMMFATVTIIHIADTKEELDEDTNSLITTGRKHLCEFSTLKYQQIEGLHTALPFGIHSLPYKWRTLTTESTAVLMPFETQEIQEKGGTYYGQNSISKNMIVADRRNLLNGNGFILGVSGSGKSFTAKREIASLALSTESDIIIIDPENEFSPLVKSLGGEVIKISAASKNHINAMDINEDYGGDENPIILKSEFILSLCEQLVGSGRLSAKEKSLIDRCTASVYRRYINHGFRDKIPTLQDFHNELMEQDEKEAKDIALAIELFTKGSLNTFAKQTNVDVNSRIICYDIKDLGKQLKTIGMLVVLDSIFNRITKNRELKKNTYIFIDEVYLLFQNEYSANFLFELWKRVRKYGAMCTGITQNIQDLLVSHTATTMLANSEFLIMLNQAATDRIELAKLLNISDTQLSYITNADVGQGLLKVGGSLVPFEDKFPKDTELYRLMTTKWENS